MSKRPIEVEKLLHWTYRDELPKGYRDGQSGRPPQISPMFVYADLGGPVDCWSREPGFPVAMGTTPHPDALTVHAAVMALEDVGIVWPSAGPWLLGELERYATDADRLIIRRMQVQCAGLVTLHARLGNRPIWHMDYTVMRVSGRDRGALVRKGKGRKHSARLEGEMRLDPSAAEILLARFEYFAWRAALAGLARDLDLIEHDVLPPAAPRLPWFGGAGASVLWDNVTDDARFLASGRLSRLAKLPLRPARPKVLAQLPASFHGPVRQSGPAPHRPLKITQ